MSRRLLAGVLAIVFCFLPRPAGAQAGGLRVSPTAPLDSQYLVDLTGLHEKVAALANAIPADKYSWRPSTKVRTVSELLMHFAGEWSYLCPASVASRPQVDMSKVGEAMRSLEAITVKPAVLEQLARSWETCRASLHAMDPARLVPDSLPAKMGFPRVVLRISADQHEHLGQLIAYARSIDVTPPWSK